MQNHMIIDTVEKLKLIALNRLKETRTYRVTSEVYRSNYEKLKESAALRPMTAHEVKELADYLEVPANRLNMSDWFVGNVTCTQCSRVLTFTDLVHESVSSGKHTKEFIVDVVSGRKGQFITVDGTNDDTHVMRCLDCGFRGNRLLQMNGFYECALAYAHCAW